MAYRGFLPLNIKKPRYTTGVFATHFYGGVLPLW